MASSKEWIINVLSDSYVSAWNSQTGETQDLGFLQTPRTFEFLDDLPKHIDMSNVKVVVFSIFDSDFLTSVQNYNFRLKCHEFCQKHSTFCYMPSLNHTSASVALTKTQTILDDGEIVLLVVSVDSSPTHAILKRENSRYKILSEGQSNLKSFSPSWKAEILGSFKPKKIIVMRIEEEFLPGPTLDIKKVKKCFKNQDVQFFYPDDAFSLITDGETALQLMNEKDASVYDVAINSVCNFEVRLGEKVLIKVTETTTVPFEESVIVDVDPKSNITLYCKYRDSKPFETLREIKCSNFTTKKAQITLKVDFNSFDNFKVERIKEETEPAELEKDRKIFDRQNSGVSKFADDKNEPVELEKGRIIFTKHHFRVSYYADGKKHIVKDKNGLKKTPVYISFVEEKPVIGKVAKDLYSDKPDFVVFDLIKLGSITNADISKPKWGFSLAKEDETLMVIMQTFEGERKARVAFLLAMVLKNGNDRIKKNYGKRMKELEIGFDEFQPNETLKENFIEAGKLLEIGIVFVNPCHSLFLSKYPKFDGRGIKIGVIDSRLDVSLDGMQKTSEALPKIIDCFDFTAVGDTDTSVIIDGMDSENNVINGLSGRKLKIPRRWINPFGIWHLGLKSLYKPNKDKITQMLPEMDCIVWFDDIKWLACIETFGDLEKAKVLTNFRDTHDYGILHLKDNLKMAYCITIHNNGTLHEIFTPYDHYGSVVAQIAAAHFPECPERDGLAHGAQIIFFSVLNPGKWFSLDPQNMDPVKKAVSYNWFYVL